MWCPAIASAVCRQDSACGRQMGQGMEMFSYSSTDCKDGIECQFAQRHMTGSGSQHLALDRGDIHDLVKAAF